MLRSRTTSRLARATSSGMRRSSGTCSSAASTLRRRSSRRCSSRSPTRMRTSTERWRQSLTSSATEVWDEIAVEAADESPLWADALRETEAQDRVAIFSTLCEPQFALGLETIYEGYLCHYGEPRLFQPRDDETRLLLGDYLYAHGLVRIADTGSVQAVQKLAELISLCAALRAEGEGGDGEAWLSTARSLGPAAPDDTAAERALAAHASHVS